MIIFYALLPSLYDIEKLLPSLICVALLRGREFILLRKPFNPWAWEMQIHKKKKLTYEEQTRSIECLFGNTMQIIIFLKILNFFLFSYRFDVLISKIIFKK